MQSTEEDDDARTRAIAALQPRINHRGLETSRSIVPLGREGEVEARELGTFTVKTTTRETLGAAEFSCQRHELEIDMSEKRSKNNLFSQTSFHLILKNLKTKMSAAIGFLWIRKK